MDSAVRIGVGPFTGQSKVPGDGRAIREAHRGIVTLAEAADALGFDSVWLSEHHRADDGYLGSLFPVLGAIAARTQRVLLGTRVALAPLYHSLRLAEDAAEVSVLSGRKLILGLGAGYSGPEFEAFGVSLSDRGRLLNAAIEVCRQEWRANPALGAEDAGIGPISPEIWIGGRAPAALRRAARVGSGYVAPLGDRADTQRLVAELDEHPTPKPSPLPIASSLMVVLSGAPGANAAEEGMLSALSSYQRLTGQGADAPRNRGAVIGDEAAVAEFVARNARATPPGRRHHVVCRFAYPGMNAEDVLNQMQFFAARVMPRIRELLEEPTGHD